MQDTRTNKVRVGPSLRPRNKRRHGVHGDVYDCPVGVGGGNDSTLKPLGLPESEVASYETCRAEFRSNKLCKDGLAATDVGWFCRCSYWGIVRTYAQESSGTLHGRLSTTEEIRSWYKEKKFEGCVVLEYKLSSEINDSREKKGKGKTHGNLNSNHPLLLLRRTFLTVAKVVSEIKV
jgi:hypothetical protein